MRILGLDIGQKTIGLAISDPLGLTAQGLTTIRRKNKQSDIEELKKVCKDYEVETLVIGLPKNMNNSIGFAGEKIPGDGGTADPDYRNAGNRRSGEKIPL